MEDTTLGTPTEEEAAYIDAMLLEYNRRAEPFTQQTPYIPIQFCLRDAEGAVIGGILATLVMWRILYIDTLWVDEAHRGKGHAKTLLGACEDAARREGCHLAHLDTFDFQAKDFYLAEGYEIFGELEDSPLGHTEYFLKKAL